jgi:hypothetical protein
MRSTGGAPCQSAAVERHLCACIMHPHCFSPPSSFDCMLVCDELLSLVSQHASRCLPCCNMLNRYHHRVMCTWPTRWSKINRRRQKVNIPHTISYFCSTSACDSCCACKVAGWLLHCDIILCVRTACRAHFLTCTAASMTKSCLDTLTQCRTHASASAT